MESTTLEFILSVAFLSSFFCLFILWGESKVLKRKARKRQQKEDTPKQAGMGISLNPAWDAMTFEEQQQRRKAQIEHEKAKTELQIKKLVAQRELELTKLKLKEK